MNRFKDEFHLTCRILAYRKFYIKTIRDFQILLESEQLATLDPHSCIVAIKWSWAMASPFFQGTYFSISHDSYHYYLHLSCFIYLQNFLSPVDIGHRDLCLISPILAHPSIYSLIWFNEHLLSKAYAQSIPQGTSKKGVTESLSHHLMRIRTHKQITTSVPQPLDLHSFPWYFHSVPYL